jgi:hypothetical protein
MFINQNKKSIFSYCNNCGKRGHIYKNCKEPVISIGIIMLDLGKIKYSNFSNKSITDITQEYTKGIHCTHEDINYYSYIKDELNFLMIRRKHTLGYIEFIRGRYKLENDDGIAYLFKQMTSDEINKISILDFDKLWLDFWGNQFDNTIENKKKKDV